MVYSTLSIGKCVCHASHMKCDTTESYPFHFGSQELSSDILLKVFQQSMPTVLNMTDHRIGLQKLLK